MQRVPVSLIYITLLTCQALSIAFESKYPCLCYCKITQELLRFTDDSHPDKPKLSASLDQITAIAQHINVCIRDRQQLQKIITLQSQFVGYCPVSQVCNVP